jgi:signal-transduction protein with cAMP-binding, CBS, and nucleotidyltransferase domain
MIEVDLRRFPLFASLGHEELEAVAARLEVRELEADQTLWREGDGALALALLDQGTVRIESHGLGALGNCEAPACLGAASLVDDGQRESSAIANGPARALLLSKTAFAELIEETPRAAAHVLAAVVGDLATTLRQGLPFLA